MLPLGGFVTAVAALWLVYTFLRRRYLARMGYRHITRRPYETVLVVAGSVLGTALIVGSYITGDSLTNSFTASVYRRMGEVDEQVVLSTPAARQRAEKETERLRSQPGIDGVVMVDTDTASVVVDGTGHSETEPRADVYALDLADLAAFGGERSTLAGAPIAPGDAVVSRELADDLHIAAGDRIEVTVGRRHVKLRVVRVAEGDGLASYRDGLDVFVAPGTLPEPGTRQLGTTRELWVSNTGSDRTGYRRTSEVRDRIKDVLGSDGVTIVPIKKAGVTAAEDGAESLEQLFLVVGTFAIIAGILLLVNIFVMLAEERKSELGMLRAIGMKRADLVRVFTLEGVMYAGLAALFGAVVGVGVGAAIVQIASKIFANSVFRSDLRVELTVHLVSVAAGGLVGFAISFVTVLLTSLRISRVNIIRAIRELPEPTGRAARRRTQVMGALAVFGGGLMTASGVSATQALPAMVGPGLVGLGLVPLLRRLAPARAVVTVIGLVVIAWEIFAPSIVPDLMKDSSPYTFVVNGLALTFAGVAVLTENQELVAGGIRAVAGGRSRRGLAARLATTYPLARRFRTGMTLVMYALVVFTLVVLSVITHVQNENAEAFAQDEAAGYDVLVHTNQDTPVDLRDLLREPGVVGATSYRRAAVSLKRGSRQAFTTVYSVDRRFLDATRFALADRDKTYPGDRAAWDAVARDASLTIVDRSYEGRRSQGPPAPVQVKLGEKIRMQDPVTGRTVSRRVVGFSQQFFVFPGAFVADRAMDEQFPAASRSQWLVRVDADDDPLAVAAALERRYVDLGLQADGMDDLMGRALQTQTQFLGLMRGYLALGLFVGIVGLGVIMIRAVRERRRAIGVLRALGFGASTVRRAFLGEAALVATEGITLGTVLGLVTAWNLFNSGFATVDVEFAIPWATVLLLAAASLAFSLLVAVFPARAASRIRPAVALRIAD